MNNYKKPKLQHISEFGFLCYILKYLNFCEFVIRTFWAWWDFVIVADVNVCSAVRARINAIAWFFTCLNNLVHNLPPIINVAIIPRG